MNSISAPHSPTPSYYPENTSRTSHDHSPSPSVPGSSFDSAPLPRGAREPIRPMTSMQRIEKTGRLMYFIQGCARSCRDCDSCQGNLGRLGRRGETCTQGRRSFPDAASECLHSLVTTGFRQPPSGVTRSVSAGPQVFGSYSNTGVPAFRAGSPMRHPSST